MSSQSNVASMLPADAVVMSEFSSEASGDSQPSSPRSPRSEKESQASWDVRKLAVVYFTVVFACRLYLRSPMARQMHWAAIMLMEDSLSILSFALALFYLCQSNGAPLAYAAGLAGASSEGAALESNFRMASGTRTVRLFYFAL